MPQVLYNQYYIDFPQSDYDKKFVFPESLCRVSYDPTGTITGESNPDADPLYLFSMEDSAVFIQAPEGFISSSIYLQLASAPDMLVSGFHKCIIYLRRGSFADGLLAVGRGTVVVLRKWKMPEAMQDYRVVSAGSRFSDQE